MQALQGRSEERRIDPEDGEARTFNELRRLCLGLYSEKEIRDYWEITCKPMPVAASAAAAARTNTKDAPQLPRESLPSVSATPSRGRAAESAAGQEVREAQMQMQMQMRGEAKEQELREQQQQEAESQGQRPLPVLARQPTAATAAALAVGTSPPPASAPASASALAPEDAPMADAEAAALLEIQAQVRPQAEPQAQAQAQAQAQVRRGWQDLQEYGEIQDLLGEGAPDRKLSAKKIQVLVPWVVFTLSLLSRALLRHCLSDLCVIFTAVASLAAVAMVLLWWSGKRRSPVSLLVLGVLCFIAATVGAGVGEFAYKRHWRQFWWIRTGRRYGNTDAATPAAARLDASIISFWEEGHNRTRAGTAVDHSRAAGFKDGRFYCVAPILSPSTAAAGSALVNYWAVGIDCCQHLGSFSCDDSRQPDAGHGVVLLEGGYPCPGCNSARFQAAVDTAERMHGLVSATDALFVRWVRDPAPALSSFFWQAVFFLVMCLLLAFAFFWLLGSLAWYYGIGHGQGSGLGNLWHSYSYRHKHIV